MDFLTKTDFYRYTARTGGLKPFIKTFLIPAFRFTYFMRKAAKHKQSTPLGFVYRMIIRHYQIKYGYQISPYTSIGEGFYIGHFGHVIINRYATIGRNCNIAAGVTIGEQSRGSRMGCPTIGNYVWMGTNCVIVGKITIGDNVLIAPGSYVNFDVPANSIVMGNPGKIIPKENATEGYIINVLNK